MNFVFRTDASILIGSGHVMRCLALASYLRSAGHEVIFICRNYPGNLIEFIQQKGFIVRVLSFFDFIAYKQQSFTNNYKELLWITQEQDASETIAVIKDLYVDWLIVDHYGLDECWHKSVSFTCKKIMAIDDLANRKYAVNYLLDYNFYKNAKIRYKNLVPNNCLQLLGPKYVILSNDVIRMNQIKKEYNAKIKKCVVFMGGLDYPNYSQFIVQKLLELVIDLEILLVIGQGSPHKQILVTSYEKIETVKVFIQPQNYYQLLASADFVIGAAGVSLLERFYIGIPSLVFQVAENQSEVCANLSYTKAAIFLGNLRKDPSCIERLSIITSLNQKMFLKMQKQAQKIVDGNGASRIMSLFHS